MDDFADLEQLAARLEQSGQYRVLRRVPVVNRYADDNPATVKRLGLIVDIETTGLDPTSDRIIELACLPFHFSSEGVLYDVLPSYAGFEDPGRPLDEEVVRLTGITDDQLLSRKLDDQAVTMLAEAANLIIAHNASFDRRFLERRFPIFIDKAWACSNGQVPWVEEGLGSAKLDYLLSRLGFFFDDHRAMADCWAVLHLLSLNLPRSGRAILPLLLANARQRAFRIWALEAPIECKDLLKQRGYRWNGGEDGRPRAWYRDLKTDLVAEEESFLAEKVYGGDCRHELVRIDYSNRFSDRV
jgi:DNA polymerase III subunit epsilon